MTPGTDEPVPMQFGVFSSSKVAWLGLGGVEWT
jgi:hypothetical protein